MTTAVPSGSPTIFEQASCTRDRLGVAVTFNLFRATAIVFLTGAQMLGMVFLALKLSRFPFGFVIVAGFMGLAG